MEPVAVVTSVQVSTLSRRPTRHGQRHLDRCATPQALTRVKAFVPVKFTVALLGTALLEGGTVYAGEAIREANSVKVPPPETIVLRRRRCAPTWSGLVHHIGSWSVSARLRDDRVLAWGNEIFPFFSI
jgi:hypothetical protein